MSGVADRFRRWVLPGLAFKSVVIGGGYATGRELAEFFLPPGPWGGVAAMVLAMAAWSVVCALTFVLARRVGARDYRGFFRALIGRGWVLFEFAYLCLVVIVLAVFGAATGELLHGMLGWQPVAGAIALVVVIATIVRAGNEAIEGLFKYMSGFLYLVYAVAALLMLSAFGDRSLAQFASSPPPGEGWVVNGLTYAGYNLFAAIAILPVLRHMRGTRDAVVAGMLAGPLAILPALVFFVCMVAFVPEIAAEPLPSDFLLGRTGHPWFQNVFRVMILTALVETGVAMVASIEARTAAAWVERTGRELAPRARLALVVGVLVASVFLADAIGLVELIARGYRMLSWMLLATYVLPLLTIGTWRLWRGRRQAVAAARSAAAP